MTTNNSNYAQIEPEWHWITCQHCEDGPSQAGQFFYLGKDNDDKEVQLVLCGLCINVVKGQLAAEIYQVLNNQKIQGIGQTEAKR